MKTASVDITPATEADLALLKNLGKQTFYETFAEHNTEADMAQYLQKSFSEEKILQEWRTSHAEFYIARYEDEPVGYLKLNWSTAQTELQSEDALEIERIYVTKKHQGHHIGQALLEKAWQVAVAKNKSFLWLAVWEKNSNAIGFYEKNGFTIFDHHIFQLGNDKQIDLMMKKYVK